MLNEVILLEYFTAQSTINFKEKKSIFKEAIKLSNELALNFQEIKDKRRFIYLEINLFQH